MEEEVVVKEPKIVLLINEKDVDFIDKCGGKTIRIPAGKAVKVLDYVAYHFAGDPRIINGEDPNAADAELKRVKQRYGVSHFRPNENQPIIDERMPKLRIEEIEEKPLEVVDAPTKKKSDESDEFPELKDGKGKKKG